MGFGAGRKRSHLLMANVNPFDRLVATDGVRNRVETVASYSVDPPDACRDECGNQLFGHGLGHDD
jgi:hypothetical protein